MKSGKPEVGEIVFSTFEDAGDIKIVIKDDGRGIDENLVVRKAVEKRIISEEQAARLSTFEKVNLIFAPNFSTKDQATDISGRGLGLDIVKSEIERAGGSVIVESQIGKGSRFILTLPSTVENSLRSSA